MQSAAARTARGFALSPSQSEERRRGRHANAGAVVKGTHMSVEKQLKATSGYGMLAVVIVALIAIVGLFIWSVAGLAVVCQ